MKLYKYSTIGDNSISVLLDRYVWFGKPSALNDPFDCGLIENQFVYERAIGNRGILSLSATHTNSIMWSHYAGSHTGMCIEFDEYTTEEINTDPLKSQLNPSGAHVDRLTITQNARPVDYLTDDQIADRMSDFPANDVELVDAFKKARADGTEDEFVNALGDTVYVKHKDWAYEQEYRIVIDDGNRGVMWPGPVTAIYLGMRASPQHCRIIANIQKQMNPQPDVFKMAKIRGSYALEPRQLSQEDVTLPDVSFA